MNGRLNLYLYYYILPYVSEMLFKVCDLGAAYKNSCNVLAKTENFLSYILVNWLCKLLQQFILNGNDMFWYLFCSNNFIWNKWFFISVSNSMQDVGIFAWEDIERWNATRPRRRRSKKLTKSCFYAKQFSKHLISITIFSEISHFDNVHGIKDM